jgi:hypothetical protein
LTAIDTSVAELTFKEAVPVTPLTLALIFAVPDATPVIILTFPTVATAVLSDAQLTSRVILCVLASLNVPVAVNDNLDPGAIVRPVGVTEIDTTWALLTVSVTELLAVPSVAVMVVAPGLRPFATPLLLPIFATPELEELHDACVVRSRVLPSLKVPIAENCWLVLAAIVVSPCTIASEARLAAFTLKDAVPWTEAEAAVIVTLPRFRAVARPLEVIDATLLLDDVHVTEPVISCVVPSENDPVAVNCCKVPKGRDAVRGVTAIEVTLALVTVRTALKETPLKLAVSVVVPAATPFASPEAPFTLIPATPEFDEVHCADAVTFCVLPSVKVPTAENCVVVPTAIDTVEGAIASEVTTGFVTVSVVLPEMAPEVAEMDDVPKAAPIASPGVELAFMPATD